MCWRDKYIQAAARVSLRWPTWPPPIELLSPGQRSSTGTCDAVSAGPIIDPWLIRTLLEPDETSSKLDVSGTSPGLLQIEDAVS